jgi:uncharacterized protein
MPIFFVLATVLAWLVWLPAATAAYGLPGYTLPAAGLLGTMGPGIAALVVTGLSEGRAGIGRLLRRLAIWRVGLRWYAFALVVRVPILLGAFFGYTLLTGVSLPASGLAWTSIFFYVAIQIPNTLLEEIGWRGFAFPRLLANAAPGPGPVLRLGLYFGLFHAGWHVPYWLTSDAARLYGVVVLLLWGSLVVSMTVVMAWVFSRTKGSLLIAWLLHLAANVATIYIPLSVEVTGNLLPAVLESVLFGTLALAIVAISLRYRRVRPAPAALKLGQLS